MTNLKSKTDRKCSRPRCPNAVRSRRLCRKHLGLLHPVHNNDHALVDATAVLAHLRRLRTAGWTWTQIGAAAGCAPSVTCELYHGKHQRIRRGNAERILAIRPTLANTNLAVGATGARRRLQGLAWMGWPASVVARRVGCKPRTLATLIYRGRISARLAKRIAEVYEDLWDKQGPSRVAAGRARQLGYCPPAVWDDSDIDDPAAEPQGLAQQLDRGRPGVNLEDVKWMSSWGMADEQIAARLGVTRGALETARRRARTAAA